jgi:hypothetical protein
MKLLWVHIMIIYTTAMVNTEETMGTITNYIQAAFSYCIILESSMPPHPPTTDSLKTRA